MLFSNRILPAECLQRRWPDVTNCAEWNIRIDEGIRTLESNSIPPYYVHPYCPFGIDEGYCQSPTQGDSADCDVFLDLKCPCKEGSMVCDTSTDVGDVLTPAYQYFEFPLHPDPTRNDLPRHMYDNQCLKNGNAYQVYYDTLYIVPGSLTIMYFNKIRARIDQNMSIYERINRHVIIEIGRQIGLQRVHLYFTSSCYTENEAVLNVQRTSIHLTTSYQFCTVINILYLTGTNGNSFSTM